MASFFHESSKISSLASIEFSIKGSNTYIGVNTVVDDFVKIKHVGGSGDICIGSDCFINSGCVIYSGNGVLIGDNVLIGPNCSITPVNHEFRFKDELISKQGFQKSKGGIIIENDVWIGANVVILDGAIIRRGSVIGANSLVNKEVAEYSVCYGSPIRKIGQRK